MFNTFRLFVPPPQHMRSETLERTSVYMCVQLVGTSVVTRVLHPFRNYFTPLTLIYYRHTRKLRTWCIRRKKTKHLLVNKLEGNRRSIAVIVLLCLCIEKVQSVVEWLQLLANVRMLAVRRQVQTVWMWYNAVSSISARSVVHSSCNNCTNIIRIILFDFQVSIRFYSVSFAIQLRSDFSFYCNKTHSSFIYLE